MSQQTPTVFFVQEEPQNSQRNDATVLVKEEAETEIVNSTINIQNATSSRAAIQACPFEILTDIFLYYLADKASRIDYLLLVCHDWNRLVTHTPILWTHINILVRAGQGPPPRGLVERYIQGSKDMLLNIRISCDQVKINDVLDEEAWITMLDLLHGTIHRWRTLHVILPEHWHFGTTICRIFKESAPNLVKLQVENFKWRARQHIEFLEIPKLHTLKLGSGYALQEMLTKFSLSYLRSLTIDLHGFEMWQDGTAPKTWPRDLSTLHSLLSLEIRNTGWADSYKLRPSEGDSIVLPRLERLAIWRVKRIDNVRFDLPKLRKLIFDCDIFFPYFPQAHPPEIVWRPQGKWEPAVHDETTRFLKIIIRQYPSSRRFVVPDWTEGSLISAVRTFRMEGTPIQPSISFMVADSLGRRENVDMSTIHKLEY
jgi:F-box-like